MNAEYQHHTQIWNLQKPRVCFGLEPAPLPPVGYATELPLVAQVVEALRQVIGGATPEHGIKELASPLSD